MHFVVPAVCQAMLALCYAAHHEQLERQQQTLETPAS